MIMIDGDNDEMIMLRNKNDMMIKREPAKLSIEEGGALEPKQLLQAVTMRSFNVGEKSLWCDCRKQ